VGKLRLSLLNQLLSSNTRGAAARHASGPSSLALLFTWPWLAIHVCYVAVPPKRFKGTPYSVPDLWAGYRRQLWRWETLTGTNCAMLYAPLCRLRGLTRSPSLDMVSVGSDQQTLTIHLWDMVSTITSLLVSRVCDLLKLKQRTISIQDLDGAQAQSTYRNVVPGDFTQSGRLDLWL